METIVKEFMEMVQIDAASLNERAVCDFVTAKLRELGCETCEDDAGEKLGGNTGNLYAVIEGGLGGSVLFSSHMDRVANGLGIKPRIEGDRIVADGTILAADDLSGVAAIIDGIRRVKASGKPFPRIEVVLTICEEKGVSGSRYIDYDRLQSKFAYVLDSPGRIGRVINSAPSKARVTIDVTGRAAHAGNAPETGINAVVAGAKVLAQIGDGRLDEESTANYATFEAKGASNVVNDKARIMGETRSRNQKKLEAYADNLRAVCARVAEETGATIVAEVDQDYQCFFVPDSDPVIMRLKKVHGDMGLTTKVEGGGGGMDANRFNEKGIVSVGVATGYTANHTSNESIVVEDLARSGEMVERLIMAYAEEL